MRKIVAASVTNAEEWKPPTLRTEKPAGVYARRSDERAKRKETDTSQSREMQTEDLLAWAQRAGWEEERLEPYFADLGLSGTLRPDERPDMLRLFDDIDAGKYDHGTVVCWQESRLFRDETQIYYNQFIQKCKTHDVLVVAASPYVMIYDFADEFLTEMFRWKCKEAGEFIKRQIKGWMHPAKLRAARQGQWAGCGNIAIGYVVDADPKSPTYKRFIAYRPHAEIVAYLFKRFAELAGDLSKLLRDLIEHPIVFPQIPEELKHTVYLRNYIMNKSGGRLRTRTAIESILTNRHYLGWRLVKGEVVKKDSHEPIVDTTLFAFAFTTLTGQDIDGNIVRELERPARYYQRKTYERVSLLKDRIQGTEGQIYVKHSYYSGYVYSYIPASYKDQPVFTNKGHIEIISVEPLDAVVVERLFFHIKKITDLPEYNKALEEKRAEKERAIAQVLDSLASIPVEQERLVEQISKAESQAVRDLLRKQVENLELERPRLQKVLLTLQKEHTEILYSLDTELSLLEAHWQDYDIDRRIALLNFLIYAVEVDMMSPRWLRVRVTWLREEWGCEQMYLCRPHSKKRWSEEEDRIVAELYPTAPRIELLAAIPDRTWPVIRERANRWKIQREEIDVNFDLPQNTDLSMLDMEFMQKEGIPLSCESTNWTPVSMYTSIE